MNNHSRSYSSQQQSSTYQTSLPPTNYTPAQFDAHAYYTSPHAPRPPYATPDNRHSRLASDVAPGYYQPADVPPSSAPSTHATYASGQQYFAGTQYPAAQPPHPHQRRASYSHTQAFVPTPSQLAGAYPAAPRSPGQPSTPPRPPSLTVPPYRGDAGQLRSPGAAPLRAPALHSSPLRSPAPPRSLSPVSPSTERFPCDACDKTFTRAHDRKRHYDTQHTSTPYMHRCRYCTKGFSRSDSLKRHVDNGCDEMP